MITGYAQYDKAKSARVMRAFLDGCGGQMAWTTAETLHNGDAAFYGVRPPWLKLWNQAKASVRTVYYLDNSWFDCARENYFRIGINAVQSWSRAPSDGVRLAGLGVQVHTWRKRGEHILVCPQTQEWLTTVAGEPDWLPRSIASIKQFSDRRIIIRNKKTCRSLAQDLKGAWIVVCHSSAAAVEALCAGIPVIVTDPKAATVAFSTSFNEIESPAMREGRLEFMARLADSQFDMHELRDGTAWKSLSAFSLATTQTK